MQDWQDAVKPNQNGIATESQKEILEGGHFPSK